MFIGIVHLLLLVDFTGILRLFSSSSHRYLTSTPYRYVRPVVAGMFFLRFFYRYFVGIFRSSTGNIDVLTQNFRLTMTHASLNTGRETSRYIHIFRVLVPRELRMSIGQSTVKIHSLSAIRLINLPHAQKKLSQVIKSNYPYTYSDISRAALAASASHHSTCRGG